MRPGSSPTQKRDKKYVCLCKCIHIKIQSIVWTCTVCCMTRAGLWLEWLVNMKFKDKKKKQNLLPFPYESDLLSVITEEVHKKFEKSQGPIYSLGKIPHPAVPMPCQANLSLAPKKPELKTSSVVTENKVPEARLCCLWKKGWPGVCYSPSFCLSFLIYQLRIIVSTLQSHCED